MDHAPLLPLILRRTPLFHPSFPFVLFWSPKAGCTSITKWFFFQVGLLDEALNFSPWVHQYRTEVFQNNIGYFESCFVALAERNVQAFKLVRDPFARAVSGYLNVATRIGNADVTWVDSTLPILNDALGFGKVHQPISFRPFVSSLSKVGVTAGAINSHLAQQFDEEEPQYIAGQIKLEEFEQRIREIESRFNLKPSPLPELTHSKHHRKSSKKSPVNLVADVLGTPTTFPRQRTPPYECFYDSELKELVHSIYKQDFDAYGYSNTVAAPKDGLV